MSTDDLLDEATRLAGDYRNLDEGRVLRALVERVQQAEAARQEWADLWRQASMSVLRLTGERDAARFELDGARAVARKDNEFLLSVRDAAWAERDAARGKLDKVREAAEDTSESVSNDWGWGYDAAMERVLAILDE